MLVYPTTHSNIDDYKFFYFQKKFHTWSLENFWREESSLRMSGASPCSMFCQCPWSLVDVSLVATSWRPEKMSWANPWMKSGLDPYAAIGNSDTPISLCRASVEDVAMTTDALKNWKTDRLQRRELFVALLVEMTKSYDFAMQLNLENYLLNFWRRPEWHM